MNSEVEGIIRESAGAARMARSYGCVIDIHVKRAFGRSVRVVIDPERTPSLDATDGNVPIDYDSAATEPMKALSENVRAPNHPE